MDVREIVESVTREILQSIKMERQSAPSRPKVLFIFCDHSAHESFIDQLIRLQNQGIDHDMLFLDGETSSWLGMQRVESSGTSRLIATDEEAPAPLELPMDYDGIVIPEIDLDNAARVALGLKGSIKAEIVYSALLLNKFVLMGKDVSGIKRSDRRCLKTVSLTNGYKKRFEAYMETIQELGVEFRVQNELAEGIIEKFARNIGAICAEGTDQSAEETLTFSGKLMSASWVRSQTFWPDCNLILQKGVIVSPLAYDLLKEKGIEVQYAAKG